MINLKDLTSSDTTNLDRCHEEALFLSNISWSTIAPLTILILVVSILVFAGSVAMDWTLLSKDAKSVVMSEEDQSYNELMLAVQTVGAVLWAMCFLIFWLAVQKSKYCTDGFTESIRNFMGIVIHGLFPSTAMSWINNLRDVCTGTQRCGSHRLCWGAVFMALLGGLVCSPVLIIGFGSLGLVKLSLLS